MKVPPSLHHRAFAILVGLAAVLTPVTVWSAESVAMAEHPLAAAIEELRDATEERLKELEELRQGAYGTDAILNVERAITRAKLDFELGVLRLQLGEQKALGHQEAVGELTTAIAALEELRSGVEAPGEAEYAPEDEEAK